MIKYFSVIVAAIILASFQENEEAWIRINLLGYKPTGAKAAVWCTKSAASIQSFQLVDADNKKVVLNKKVDLMFGPYGPFSTTARLDFSSFTKSGSYYLQAGNVRSPVFTIGEDVYKGTADFCLRYMRQQRSGFNPFLNDSCHTDDGYTIYGPMPDSTHLDVSGGWHDASDYLQYVTTSANATWHLLAAYRDFPTVFTDSLLSNGLAGRNDTADILDEAKWGLQWLLKMHPNENWMFNQLADDRDHMGMRIPKMDSFYDKGFERPVYYASGKPQGIGRYKNRTKGVASTAGKFSSAFSLGSQVFDKDQQFAALLKKRSLSAYNKGLRQPGVCQTAPGRAPYFYEEDNWTDDMELAAVQLYTLQKEKRFLGNAITYADLEPHTPWLGTDTAKHYQWYPFINVGHYELAKILKGNEKKRITDYYRAGITKVKLKATKNAFFRGIPFIWCSNNLTTSFAIQCYWYEQLTGDRQFRDLAQANFDWLFGCNPWGTSFVYGLPEYGDTPVDPHSAFTHLKNYPIDGGLVDGPVYGSIYRKLIGITLYQPDEYAQFQSDLVVYHDDYGDYSTNEPTMDGTASLIYLLALMEERR
jgi:hypothetical protein